MKTFKYIATAFVLVTIGGITYFVTKESTVSPSITAQKTVNSVVVEPEVVSQPVNTPTEPLETPTVPIEQVQVQSTPEPEPTPVAPAVYGTDPNRPTLIVVFDAQLAMSQAGIPASAFDKVDYIVKNGALAREWAIDETGGLTLFRIPSNGASDYNSNPITQLNWANEYVNKNFGSWDNAYNHFYARRNLQP